MKSWESWDSMKPISDKRRRDLDAYQTVLRDYGLAHQFCEALIVCGAPGSEPSRERNRHPSHPEPCSGGGALGPQQPDVRLPRVSSVDTRSPRGRKGPRTDGAGHGGAGGVSA